MGLPWRTFAQSQTLMQTLTAGKLTTADLGTLYNLAMREIIESHQWSARLGETVVNTVTDYTTGTADVTQDSTTILGSSTTWTTDMVGRFIRIGTENMFYKIATRTSDTEITIERAYPGDTDTGLAYTIFQYIYPIDGTAGEVGQILWPTEDQPFEERSLHWLNLRDPARLLTGGPPLVWVPHGLSATGQFQVEFWPRYTTATSVRIPYYKRVDDLSGSSQPIVRSDLIEALALAYAFSLMYTKFGDPQYERQEQTWEKRFVAKLEAAMREDEARHGLPQAVQEHESRIVGYDYMVTHDI